MNALAEELETERQAEIDELTSKITQCLIAADRALSDALQAVKQLESDQVYHLGYAEGTAGEDCHHLIKKARRTVRQLEYVTQAAATD
jgi:hypothetical protein